MGNNLDLYSGPQTFFATFYSDEDWARDSLLECDYSPVSNVLLDDICRQANAALRRGLREKAGRRDWSELLRVGDAIQSLLPHDVYHALATRADKSPGAQLTLRLRGELIRIPWELMHFGDGRLLGDVFDVGRQVMLPANHCVTATKFAVSEPIRVLIIADQLSEHSVKEANSLADRLDGFSGRIKVSLSSSLSKNKLLEELGRADILHYAGHAAIDPDDDQVRGWRLRKNEYITCDDIFNSTAEHWPVLVVANTCCGGQVVCRSDTGGFDGMAYAFLRRGVLHCIGAVEDIPDINVVRQFTDALYQNLLAHKSVGAALREARAHISLDSGIGRNVTGQIVAAGYVHYGSPSGCIFAAAEPNHTASKAVDQLVDAMIARLQGRTEEARRQLTDIRAGIDDDTVVKHLEELLCELDQEREDRDRIRRQLKDNTGPSCLAGAKVGPYELMEELGHGTYRTVYRARSYDPTISEMDVALALPYDQRTEVAERECQAFQELASKVRHPGLVRIFDVSLNDEVLTIAYEHFDGRPLSDLMTEKPGPWHLPEVKQIVRQAAEALIAVEEQGIVHGRLTPRDILIGSDGTVKLLDVGRYQTLSKAGVRSAPGIDDAYKAPEHWTGGTSSTSPLWDTWSLSVIAYQLLTGHHPFGSHLKYKGSKPDWRGAIVGKKAESMAAYVPGLMGCVAIESCLDANSADWPVTLEHLLNWSRH